MVLTAQDGATGSSWFGEIRQQKAFFFFFKLFFVRHWKRGSIAVWIIRPAKNEAGQLSRDGLYRNE